MTLEEAYPNWWMSPPATLFDGAIFRDFVLRALVKEETLPWGNEIDTAVILDRAFVGSYGERPVSPIVTKLKDKTSVAWRENVCAVVYDMFMAKWKKFFDTLSFDYNPIENYAMTETMTNDERLRYYGKTSTRTDDLRSKNTGSTRTAPNLTDTESVNNYGFNSVAENGEPTEQRVLRKSGSNINTVDLSNTDTGTQTYADGGSDREEHSYTLNRTGNIGTVTAQDMIKQEREILMFDYFYDVVFPDILRVLTLKIY